MSVRERRCSRHTQANRRGARMPCMLLYTCALALCDHCEACGNKSTSKPTSRYPRQNFSHHFLRVCLCIFLSLSFVISVCLWGTRDVNEVRCWQRPRSARVWASSLGSLSLSPSAPFLFFDIATAEVAARGHTTALLDRWWVACARRIFLIVFRARDANYFTTENASDAIMRSPTTTAHQAPAKMATSRPSSSRLASN